MPAAVIGFVMGDPLYVQIGVLTHFGALLFQIVTLPVEFDASKRARQQLDELQMVDEVDKQGVREMLRAAAMMDFALARQEMEPAESPGRAQASSAARETTAVRALRVCWQMRVKWAW